MYSIVPQTFTISFVFNVSDDSSSVNKIPSIFFFICNALSVHKKDYPHSNSYDIHRFFRNKFQQNCTINRTQTIKKLHPRIALYSRRRRTRPHAGCSDHGTLIVSLSPPLGREASKGHLPVIPRLYDEATSLFLPVFPRVQPRGSDFYLPR